MQTQERIYHLAYHDILTQLPNRGLFVDRLNHALARQRDPNKFLAVLFMDLDRFKIINDTLGHDIGDRLLKMFSERIVKCLREGDTVARLAGDEFVILLEGIAASEDVAPICRKILDSLTLPFRRTARNCSSREVSGSASPRRRRRRGDADPQRGYRHVPRQGIGEEQLPVLFVGHEREGL